jgi:hypothetical protein
MNTTGQLVYYILVQDFITIILEGRKEAKEWWKKLEVKLKMEH